MPEQSPEVVSVHDLRKSYGDVKAVDGISFSVIKGEIFGIVGPNGAGKTTTMDCIVGMKKSDSGSLSVLGLDPIKQGLKLRQRLGIQQQESELPDRIRVRETMELFSSFYNRTLEWRDILDHLALMDKSEAYFSDLSGGQKRRLFVALALIGDPEILFLDELTSGLDPQARRIIWKLVTRLRDEGRTIFLSTHYMDEAEKLCDRVAIIDKGRIIALDTPDELISSLGFGIRVIFTASGDFSESTLNEISGILSVERDGDRITCTIRDSSVVLEIVKKLIRLDTALDDFRTERTTLEDVFLAVTGKEVRN
ncbi:MAG: ABC transporter ATP-binding protein [Candidatus Aegiribacteria sp.]|nr:ABC transporter ATP-binding protein [Candidatus Aegiribacteria sp.]